jgi:hypothetical protein
VRQQPWCSGRPVTVRAVADDPQIEGRHRCTRDRDASVGIRSPSARVFTGSEHQHEIRHRAAADIHDPDLCGQLLHLDDVVVLLAGLGDPRSCESSHQMASDQQQPRRQGIEHGG